MPPFERHLTLAKQAMSAAASGGARRKQKQSLGDALRHYELAAKHGSLSHQQQRVLDGLRQRLRA
jgi:hypothetical protein